MLVEHDQLGENSPELRTVVDSNSRFNNLCSSHLQSQSEL